MYFFTLGLKNIQFEEVFLADGVSCLHSDSCSTPIVMMGTLFYTSVALLVKRRENYPSPPAPQKKRIGVLRNEPKCATHRL